MDRQRRLTIAGLIVALLIIGFAMYLVWRPALPVAVTFRPAFDGNSLVAQFHNVSEHYVVVEATFENAGLHQKAVKILNLGP